MNPWIEINLPWRSYNNFKASGFSEHILCRPGVEIVTRHITNRDMASYGEVRTYLIGHIKPDAMDGFDSSVIDNEDIVLRARIIYTPDY